MRSAAPISQSSLIRYGALALPVAFAGFPLYILAPDFYATQHGVSLATLGVLLLIIRLFDAVQDPLIGWVADRLQGRFYGLLTGAGVMLCLALGGLFNAVFFSPVVWFAVCMMCAVSAYSVLTIVLGAQGALWTTHPDDQTRISSVRESFGLLGLVIAVSLPSGLASFVPQSEIYFWYALCLALLMAGALFCFPRFTPSASSTATTKSLSTNSPFEALRAVPRETRYLLGLYALSFFASSLPAVLVVFFVRDLLQAPQLIGLFLLLYFLSGAVAMPLWRRLSSRYGKYQTWVVSSLLSVLGFMGAFFLQAGDVWQYALICVASGLAFGADLALPPSILADQIHAHDNHGYAATHVSLMAFVTKASLALASAVALPLLDYAGFRPQENNSSAALIVLSVTYALVPCLLKLAGAVLLYFCFVRTTWGGQHETFGDHRNNRSSYHA